MANHGTRTMYVHYGCRCEACCKAEHKYYLKRGLCRTHCRSKWDDNKSDITTRAENQRKHNHNRYIEYTKTKPYRKRIRWQDLADKYEMKCAMCGILTNPNDIWFTNGRKCYGRSYPTVDHIVSLKNGGEDIISNVQLLCKHCNSAKGSRP